MTCASIGACSGGDGADLVGQRGEAELDAFAGVSVGLPVERLMPAELLEHDHRQKAGAGPAARRGVEQRRLGDALAVAAGELLAHRLDDLPPARDDLQRVGDVLAHLHQPGRAAGGAGAGRGQHDALARQVLGEGLAHRLAALEGGDLGLRLRRRRFGKRLVHGRRRLQRLQLQLELVEQPLLAFGAMAVERAAQRLDLQPQTGDQRLASRQRRLRMRGLGGDGVGARLGRRERGAQGCDFRGGVDHAPSPPAPAGAVEGDRPPRPPLSQPAAAGRQVCRGFRQSMPSRR